MRVAALIFHTPPEDITAFAEACLRFSPTIAIKRKGCLLIEIGGCRLLYQEDTFVARARVLLKRFGLSAKIGIADNIVEAIVHTERGTTDKSRLPTQTFHDYIDPFRSDEKLVAPIAHLIESLRHLGITSVSQFLNLPIGEVSARFGTIALYLRRRITSEIGIDWPLWTPPETIVEVQEFEEEDRFCTIESLLYYLKPTVTRVFNRLYGRGFGVTSVRIQLELEKYSTVKEPLREWRMEFMFPQTSSRVALPVIRERLSRDLAAKPLESPTQKLTFEILQTVRNNKSQRNFFSPQDDSEELFKAAFSQLAEGLGRDKVFRAAINEDPVPELSWSKCMTEQAEVPNLEGYLPRRPTKLLRVPEPIYVLKNSIFIRKKPYRIARWSAVEQISAHWLDSEVVRSYYRVAIYGKPTVWIFKTKQDEYFLHGYFG